MSIKEEVWKEMTNLTGYVYSIKQSHVSKAIDLTQQKMIEEFKEMIDRYADKWQKVNTDLCEKKIINVVAESRQRNWIQTFCRELKSQVSNYSPQNLVSTSLLVKEDSSLVKGSADRFTKKQVEKGEKLCQ